MGVSTQRQFIQIIGEFFSSNHWLTERDYSVKNTFLVFNDVVDKGRLLANSFDETSYFSLASAGINFSSASQASDCSCQASHIGPL